VVCPKMLCVACMAYEWSVDLSQHKSKVDSSSCLWACRPSGQRVAGGRLAACIA